MYTNIPTTAVADVDQQALTHNGVENHSKKEKKCNFTKQQQSKISSISFLTSVLKEAD
jgi:hypothetical protein